MTQGRFNAHLVSNLPLSAGVQPVPAAPLRFGDTGTEVTFQIVIVAILGAPTAWKVEARTLLRSQHVGGPNSAGFQNRGGVWFPAGVAESAAMGVTDWSGTTGAIGTWATIADQTSHPELAKANYWDTPTAIVGVQRTLTRFGPDARTELRITLTGGTSPTVALGASTFTK